MGIKAIDPAGAKSKRLASALTLCVYGILLCVSVSGLDRDRTIAQFHHTAWTAKEGAPEQIRAIAQTNDGYLWLGTSTGLYRFDGVQFDAFGPRSGDSFPSNNIQSLLAAPDGGLWIGYLDGGVSFLKDGNLTNYSELQGLPPGRVYNFAQDNEGTIWVATAGGLFRLEDSRWQRIGLEWNYPGKIAQTVFVDKKGTLWVATEDTVVFLPKGTRSFQPTGEKTETILRIAESRDGAIWIAETSRAVRQLKVPGIEPRSLGPEIQVGSISILFDREGALWVSTIGDGIRRVPYTDRFRGGKIAQFSTSAEIFTEKEGLSANMIYMIFEDREGNIWTVTANGLDRFRESALVPVSFPPGESFFGLAAGNDGKVWILARDLWVMRTRNSTPFRLRENEGGSVCIFRDEEDTFWIDGHNTVLGLSEDGSPRIKLPTPVKNRPVTHIFKDREKRLWIYLQLEGLFRLKDGIWERFDRQTELPKSDPNVVTIDSSNRKWLGYAGNILTVIDGDRVRTFSGDEGLHAGNIKVIYERAGRLWVAGTLGVAVFEKDRFRMLAAAEGTEALTGVAGIVEAHDGSLWLNTNRGVIHIPAEEVRLALENPAHRIRYRIFDFLDGLPGAAQQNRPFPTTIEGTDGRFWFSTTKGVAWIDPQQISGNPAPPPVAIRSITADEKLYEPEPALKLPKGTTRLQIDFTALSLSIPERIHFRYKLETVDGDWQESGTRRQAFYNSLGAGQYQFRVIASNQNGVWNETETTLNFTIEPMFYQTIWFRLAIFAVVLLFVGVVLRLLYVRRIAQTTKRLHTAFEERLAERNRISHELHDTLLQGFFSIIMHLQAISNLLPAKAGEAKENLDEVLDQADIVLEEGRRALWDIHASSIKEHELVRTFTLVGEELNKLYQTDFSLTVEGKSRPLHPLVRDEVYRIGREALINAFRHSKATKIEFEIEYAPKKLRIIIRDNGCGISPDYLSAGREGHLGLLGMREYAEKIGAELKIWSRADSGTEIELIVPHHIAFVKESSDNLLKRVSRLLQRKAAPDNNKK